MKELNVVQMEEMQGGIWLLLAWGAAVWFLGETMANPGDSVKALMNGYNSIK